MTRLLLLANAHALDLLTTLWCIGLVGIGLESNPLVRAIWGAGGMLGLVASKALGVAVFAYGARRRMALLTFGICLGLVGAVLNAASIGFLLGYLR